MQEAETARNALGVVTPAALAQMRLAPVLSNQVRVNSGFTHAPDCINRDTGRMMWSAMVLRMSSGGSVKKRRPPAKPVLEKIEPNPADYALPAALQGTKQGRLYAILLAQADGDSGVMPSNEDLEHRADCSGGIHALLHILVTDNWITREAAGGRREICIVATGQILRSAAPVRNPARSMAA